MGGDSSPSENQFLRGDGNIRGSGGGRGGGIKEGEKHYMCICIVLLNRAGILACQFQQW